MTAKVRINLANPQELLELPGLSPEQAQAIVSYRAQHGPIEDPRQLAAVLGTSADVLSECADFSPAESTAPEAPGA